MADSTISEALSGTAQDKAELALTVGDVVEYGRPRPDPWRAEVVALEDRALSVRFLDGRVPAGHQATQRVAYCEVRRPA